MGKKPKADRLKPISLHPLSPDEALRGAMQVSPPEDAKPKKRKARKAKKKRKKKAR